jgi:hypothetical protein
MRQLYRCLLVLVCATAVLIIGSLLPRLVLSGEGVGGYSGEKKAFARFALVYDLELREWPFPVDPTVARRVTAVSGTHDLESPCNSEEGPRKDPYYTGYFAGDYRAEVVHYGPFFVPTGKNVFNCDVASTFSFFLPRDTRGIIPNAVSLVVFLGALALALAAPAVPVFLIIGGGLLLAKGAERKHRTVGGVSALLGLALAGTVVLAIATAAI